MTDEQVAAAFRGVLPEMPIKKSDVFWQYGFCDLEKLEEGGWAVGAVHSHYSYDSGYDADVEELGEFSNFHQALTRAAEYTVKERIGMATDYIGEQMLAEVEDIEEVMSA